MHFTFNGKGIKIILFIISGKYVHPEQLNYTLILWFTEIAL